MVKDVNSKRPGRGARLLHGGLARTVRIISGARIEMSEGRSVSDIPTQAIYYANHSSHLDFVTIWAVLPPSLRASLRPIAARDYWDRGFRKVLANRVFRAHLVDRGKGRSRGARTSGGASPAGQLGGMTAVLDEGDSLLIFPEGTRGDGENLARFHAGLFLLARHAPHVPVVPVRLGNLNRVLPKGEAIPVPHLSTVRFQRPIFVAEDEAKEDFLDRARQALLEDQ